jgi:hypothetical protein
MKAKILGSCLAMLSIFATALAGSCGGPAPEGSVLHYTSEWGEAPSGTPTMFRQLEISADIQNVGGDGALWINAEIAEKNLLMEGTGLQSLKVYLKQGEEKTYMFDFWLDWTKQSSFSVWCSDKPVQSSSELGTLHLLVMDKDNVVLQNAQIVSQSQPGGQPKLTGDTKSDGTVDFSNVKQGKYDLLVSRYGFESVQFEVTVTGGMTTNLTINLVSNQTSTASETETTTGLPPGIA